MCWWGTRSRCTGYRPILDAFKVFAKVEDGAYTEEAIAASLAAPEDANNAAGDSVSSRSGRSSSDGDDRGPTSNDLLKVRVFAEHTVCQSSGTAM